MEEFLAWLQWLSHEDRLVASRVDRDGKLFAEWRMEHGTRRMHYWRDADHWSQWFSSSWKHASHVPA